MIRIRCFILCLALLAFGAFIVKADVLLDSSEHSRRTGFVKCPYDNYYASWNGETTVINAVTWYVMKCPQGHKTLSRSP